MSRLALELRKDGRWVEIGALHVGDPPGTMSHRAPDARQIYQFRHLGDTSTIERSVGGVDVDVTPLVRLVSSQAFEQVAELSASEPTFECWLLTDVAPEPRHVRFHHHDD